MVQKGRTSLLRACLWAVWFFLAVLIGSLAIASFAPPDKDAGAKHTIGMDFIAFYRAGVLVRSGQAERLYDVRDTQDFDRSLAERENLGLGNTYGLFLNPPFFAWVFVPLVGLGYGKALFAWEMLNIACFIGASVLLCRIISTHDWKDWALAPCLMMVSLPFIQIIGHGQNTFLSLLLMSCVVTAWRNGRGFLAGVNVGILFYKPQLAAVMLGALVITLGWRALAGAAVSLGALLAITLLTLPGTLGEYIRRLGPNAQYMLATHSYLWSRHATFNGFWHVLQNRFGGIPASLLAMVCSLPLAVGLLVCVWHQRKTVSRDRIIAAVITAAPLIMPYYLDYDLLLLAIPAVLLATEMIERDRAQLVDSRDRWLVRLWIGLFLLLLINPGLTAKVGFNFSIPLLVAIAVLHIARARENSPAAVAADHLTAESLGNSLPWPAAA